MNCGIYKITCIDNGKVYIGSSSNITQRWYSHKSRLKNNKHCNKNLTNSYNKYGIDSFIYEILEECNVEVLIEREIYWADYYKKSGFELFNCGDFIDNPTRSVKLSYEHRKLCGKGGLGKIPHNKGKKSPQWVCDKISKRQKEIGRKPTQENIEKLRIINKQPKSKEHKYKISKTRTKIYGVKVKCLQTNEIFDSYTDAAKKYNTSYQNVRQSINENRKCRGVNFIRVYNSTN